ncbi:MAG TPA: FAD-dependent monooxygenase, partial [Candidatus Polarisedimenticolaceae bacterium]|nr:FAD-dependent monooxygenase [Candidatus Polarisedimenticolaceae bacterium]
MRSRDYDAVIVGARCAGAATAMLLARRGLRVLAIDRASYGRDTLSTNALMRGGVLQLGRWGLLGAVEAAGTPAVRHTAFHYGDEVIDIAIKPRDGIDALYAPRRTVLDALLVDAAREAGATVRFGARFRELLHDAGGRVRAVVIENADGTIDTVGCRIAVGADGVRSTVARAVGAGRYRVARHATGVVYGYFHGLELDGYHWYYRALVSAGAIRTNDDLTCVFASVPANR